MSFKNKAQQLIINTALPLINYQIGLIANRIAQPSTIGKITDISTDNNGNVTGYVVKMGDGTITTGVPSGGRPMGIGTAVANIDGVLF